MSPPPAEQFAARIFIGPALRAQPDRRLVDLVRDGYEAAFEEIVRRYRRPLDRFAAAIVGSRSEDVTQDAFSKALLALRGSEAEIELRPWLYRIVRNTALNDLRGRGPAIAELPEALPGGRSTAAEVEAREELRDLMERLGALPEPQRAALVMRELEGLSHEEIAAALGVSGGAARQAIYRARATLREGFGLLLPLPVLRALAEHGNGAGGAIAAGAGASSAGGAAIGGLGGSALKVGVATVLLAGTVGAGVAIEHHPGRRGPEAAEAAPLLGPQHGGRRGGGPTGSRSSASEDGGHGGSGGGQEDHVGEDRSDRGTGSLGEGGRSGSGQTERNSLSEGSSHSGEGPSRSGGDSGGPSSNSGPGSGSGDRHGGSGSNDSGGAGPGDDSSGDGGSSGPGSGDGDGSISGGEDSSGPGSGEVASEPVPTTEPNLSESSEDGGGSGSGEESSGEGSGSGSSGGGTSGLDGSP